MHDSTRVRDARVAAEAAAARAGLDEGRAAGCALVATELATNLLKHAGGGLILLDVVSRPAPERADGAAPMVQIVAIDHGPGMRDVAGALRDGFSTTSSLGAGLGTCRRVADDFDLHSTVGRGTIALARLGARPERRGGGPAPSPAPAVRAGGVNVPFAGAEFSGDAWAWVRKGDLTTLMLADGLGHGLAAARASSAAVEQLYRAPELSPAHLLRRLDGRAARHPGRGRRRRSTRRRRRHVAVRRRRQHRGAAAHRRDLAAAAVAARHSRRPPGRPYPAARGGLGGRLPARAAQRRPAQPLESGPRRPQPAPSTPL